MGWLFKKTLLRSATPMLIMELPPYKAPVPLVVMRHMWDRSKLFLRRAGTVILGINILLWFLASYPRNAQTEQEFAARRAAIESQQAAPAVSTPSAKSQRQQKALDNEQAGTRLRQSFAGH